MADQLINEGIRWVIMADRRKGSGRGGVGGWVVGDGRGMKSNELRGWGDSDGSR